MNNCQFVFKSLRRGFSSILPQSHFVTTSNGIEKSFNEDNIMKKYYTVDDDVSSIEIIGDLYQHPDPLSNKLVNDIESSHFSFILSTKSYKRGISNQVYFETLYHRISCCDMKYLSLIMDLPINTSLHIIGLLKYHKPTLLINSKYEIICESLKLHERNV